MNKGPKLHELPGYRRVPITLVLHLYETIQENWEDGGRFHIEENHCLDNYVSELHQEMEAEPNVCQTCHRAEAYLGHLSFDEIRTKVQEAMPHQGYTPPQSGEDT